MRARGRERAGAGDATAGASDAAAGASKTVAVECCMHLLYRNSTKNKQISVHLELFNNLNQCSASIIRLNKYYNETSKTS